MTTLEKRMDIALTIGAQAAQIALQHFRSLNSLTIEQKGKQDFVSNADREVEQYLRQQLHNAFEADGIIGEEFDNIPTDSGYTWVIDPIDGTASFIVGRPGWCVVLACIHDGRTILGVVIDPVAKETYRALLGQGAWLNDAPVKPSSSQRLDNGSVGVGYSNKFPADLVINLQKRLLHDEKGIYYQNGSGALMLVYVASGRLIGYTEAHMYPWDCLAALLIVEEAGGLVQQQDLQRMLKVGERVVAACPGVFEKLVELSDQAYGDYRRG